MSNGPWEKKRFLSCWQVKTSAFSGFLLRVGDLGQMEGSAQNQLFLESTGCFSDVISCKSSRFRDRCQKSMPTVLIHEEIHSFVLSTAARPVDVASIRGHRDNWDEFLSCRNVLLPTDHHPLSLRRLSCNKPQAPSFLLHRWYKGPSKDFLENACCKTIMHGFQKLFCTNINQSFNYISPHKPSDVPSFI